MTARRCALTLGLALLVLFAPFLALPGSILFSPHSDFIVFHAPIRALITESMQRFGSFPQWCPFLFCGFPLAGLGDPQTFYPPTWAYFLARPEATLRIYGYLVLAHLWLGGLGMAAYLRARQHSGPACLLGGLIFMLQGKWLAFLLLAQNSMLGWAWFPWVLLAMDRLHRRLSWQRVLELAGLVALLVLGLHAPLTAIAAYFLVGYGAVSVLHSRSWKLALALLAGCVLAGALCAASLLPTLEYSRFTLRGLGLTLEQASQGQVPMALLPLLLTGAYPPARIGWEMCLFCGTLPWCLALLSGQRRNGWGAGILLVMLLAAGTQTALFGLAYKLIPGFALFRFPARYCLLIPLMLAPLAASALDRAHLWKRWELLILWLGSAGMAALGQSISGGAEGWWGAFWASGLLLTPLRWRRPVLILLCALELLQFGSQMVDPRPPQFLGEQKLTQLVHEPPGQGRTLVGYSQMLIPPYALREKLEISNGLTASVPKATYSLMQEGVAELPGQPQVCEGIPSFEPRSAAYLRRANLVHVLSDRPLQLGADWAMRRSPPFTSYDFLAPQGFSNFPPLFIYDDQHPLARQRLVGKALAAENAEAALRLARATDAGTTVVIEGAAPQPTGEQPQANVTSEWLSYDQRRLSCRVAGPGAYLVLSEMYYPGWKLSEGNRELVLQRADGYFMAAYLTPGEHTLSLEYRPQRFRQSLWISLFSAVALLLTYGVDRVLKSRRRQSAHSQP